MRAEIDGQIGCMLFPLLHKETSEIDLDIFHLQGKFRDTPYVGEHAPREIGIGGLGEAWMSALICTAWR